MQNPLGETFTLASPGGDGRHPYLDKDGAFLGCGVPLLEKAAGGRWQPRSADEIARLMSLGYGRAIHVPNLMAKLHAVARALNKGDRSLASIALVHASLPPLPDEATALRMAQADALTKEETHHWPAQPRDHGKWEQEGKLPAGKRRLSLAGVVAIKKEEGLKHHTYRDGDSQNQTIGYGHKLRPGESFPDGIDEPQATALLQRDLNAAEQAVQTGVKVDLTQAQYDALVSLTFNIGTNALKDSSLLRQLNQGDYAGAADQFGRWNWVNGRQNPNLTDRRKRERDMFLGKQ